MTETTEALVWENPPPPPPRRVDRVAAQLRARPNEWALIDDGPCQFFCWWAPLNVDPAFEVKLVYADRRNVFGRRKIYVRFVDPEVPA